MDGSGPPTRPWSHTVAHKPDDEFSGMLNLDDLNFAGSESILPSDLDQQYPLTDMYSIPPDQQQYSTRNYAFPPPSTVPMTPNSSEIHGTIPQYAVPVDALHKPDQLDFTPLASPAVTPLDSHFQYPDYSGTSDAFSPLTSPALRAQASRAPNLLSSIDGPVPDSPADFALLDYHIAAAAQSSFRKGRRKISAGSIKPPARSVIQSPAMKPHRKQRSGTVGPVKDVGALMEHARRSGSSTPTGNLSLPYSGPDSVSPEPLNEILMPPPATPRSTSATHSPFLIAQGSAPLGEAATPASLMRLRQQAERNGHVTSPVESEMSPTFDNMMLPEAAYISEMASMREIPGQYDKSASMSRAASGEGHQGKTSGHVSRVASGHALDAMQRSDSANAPASGQISPRGDKGKARRRMGVEKASPALRPKFSPSIQPLLREASSEASALLATKSNYQNIMEGTQVPGMSYPEALSSNLTSKRTSHKLAEQGRRNRINVALQEIASLIPPSTPGADDSPPDPAQTPNMAAQQHTNSKASTVEAAIEYIKSLQQEVRDCKDKIASFEASRR